MKWPLPNASLEERRKFFTCPACQKLVKDIDVALRTQSGLIHKECAHESARIAAYREA